MLDEARIKWFLTALHGESFARGLWVPLFCKQTRQTEFCRSLDHAVAHTLSLADSHDVYVGLGALGERPESGRGSAEQVAFVPGFFADLDIDHAAHGNAKIKPADIEEALDVVIATQQLPSVINHSGHGLHAFWLLKEAPLLHDGSARSEMRSSMKRWGDWVLQCGKQRGYEFDVGSDLARVVRIPGTLNHKQPDVPVPVTTILPEAPCAAVDYCCPGDLLDVIHLDTPPSVTLRRGTARVDLDDEPRKPEGLRWRSLLDDARDAHNGVKFRRLYDDGDFTRFPSQSEADFELCRMLAFWTDNNPQAIDYYFRESALCRDKWLDRRDYRQNTIARAIAVNQEHQTNKRKLNNA